MDDILLLYEHINNLRPELALTGLRRVSPHFFLLKEETFFVGVSTCLPVPSCSGSLNITAADYTTY